MKIKIKMKKAYVVRYVINYDDSYLAREEGIEKVLEKYKDNLEDLPIGKAYFNTIAEANAYEQGVNDTDEDYYTDIIIERVPVAAKLRGSITYFDDEVGFKTQTNYENS